MPRDLTFPTPPAPSRRIVLTGALLVMMLAALDSSIVNTALPRMAAELGGLAHLSWVVTAFMLSSTITTPLYGKLSDLYGRRNMFTAAILMFLAGSILCGAAGSMNELIGFRAVQGLGAGGLLVLAQAMIGDVVPPTERPRYQGLFTATFGFASVAGPLIGGIITQALSWRWIFYVNLPIGLAALLMVRLGLRHVPARAPDGKPHPVDLAGMALIATLTTSLLVLLAGGGGQFAWGSAGALALGALTLLCLGLFIWREAYAAEPIIRLGLFRNAVFTRGSAVGGMVMFAMLGALVFMPLYFQLVLGISPAMSGAMILPQVGCMLLSSILGGRIVGRSGHTRAFLLAGVGLEMASLIGLAALAGLDAPAVYFLFLLGALGLGMGMGMPNLTNAIQNAVAHKELGAATGAMVFIRSLGGAVGVAVSGAIMTARLGDAHRVAATGMHALTGMNAAQHASLAAAYRHALTGSFLVSAGVMVVAFVVLLGLPEIRLRNQIED